ncbi:MAG: glycogen synthase [Clostridia bacterium]|nr:glycogen synthase [Clostridia bacterium]
MALNVLLIASEAHPFVKTGGLGDVSGTLPAALNRIGVNCSLMLPMYSKISSEYVNKAELVANFDVKLGWRMQPCSLFRLTHGGICVYLIGSDYYFNRPYIYGDGMSDAERFSFFCKAAIESIPHLDEIPHVLHLNDWHTGMIPLLLKQEYLKHELYSGIKTLYTIHNLRYQGLFDMGSIKELLSIDDEYATPSGMEYYGNASFMKAGIVFADRVSTVSETYSREILKSDAGEGLDGVLRSRQDGIYGIMNGIDTTSFDPNSDPSIEAGFSADMPEKKVLCKAALQREMGLFLEPDMPLIGVVSRLTEQKGFQLLTECMDAVLNLGVSLCVLGSGDAWMEEYFSRIAHENPGRVAFYCGYSDALARRIYAGSDMILMPSQFEPCGISQLIAMRYGSLPIVRETGGLKDSVEPYNRFTRQGTGFTFTFFNAVDMYNAIERAVTCYHDKAAFNAIRRNAMDKSYDWLVSALKYRNLYESMRGAPENEA